MLTNSGVAENYGFCLFFKNVFFLAVKIFAGKNILKQFKYLIKNFNLFFRCFPHGSIATRFTMRERLKIPQVI